MSTTTPSKLGKNNKGVTKLVVLLVILLLGGTNFAVYTSQSNKVDQLNKRVSDLTAQLESAKNESRRDATTTYNSLKAVKIKVYEPASGSTISSPQAIIGEIPGNWSFEASFPVVLKDSAGTVIAKAPAQVLGDWMTDQLVPFSVKLTFTAPDSGTGLLILQKDNPSGLTSNDDAVSIPIKF